MLLRPKADPAAAALLPELHARRERVMELFREYNDGAVTRNQFALIVQLLGLQVRRRPWVR